MGNTITNGVSTLTRSQKSDNSQSQSSHESSRVLFLLYLINRTWNVVVDTVDVKGRRSRSSQATSEDSGAPRSLYDEHFDLDLLDIDDGQSSLYDGSQYSFCSCSYCHDSNQKAFFSSSGLRMSICERKQMEYDRDTVVCAAACIIIANAVKERKSPRCWVRPYLKSRPNETLIKDLQVDMLSGFRNFARISSSDFESLAMKIGPSVGKKNTNFRTCVSINERLAITLRFLATGDSFTSLSYLFKVSKQLISRIVPEVCGALINALAGCIKMPRTHEDWKTIEDGFSEQWQFPHCVGALDGKHIVIQAPPNSGSKYFNYKSTFSIVLLGLVDANCKFIYVNIGCQGRISDGGVFRNSTLNKAISDGSVNFPEPEELPGTTALPFVFVADDAFALNENLMKPVAGHHPKGSKERIFNYRLSRARRISENAFGILSSVFRVLRKPMILDAKKASIITLCCVFLHNFLIDSKSSSSLYSLPGNLDREAVDSHRVIEGTWRNDIQSATSFLPLQNIPQRPQISAKRIREEFANYFISEQGSVPWQNLYA